jgi:hypothetical protein
MGAALLAPLLHILAIGLVPDTLLMFFHLAVMAHTLRLMVTPQPRLAQWLLLGVLLGLAGLSKYTAIFTAVAVVCARCAPMVGACRQRALATLFLVVVIAARGYLERPAPMDFFHPSGAAWGRCVAAVHLLRFLLVQVLAYGPIVVAAFSCGASAHGVGWRFFLRTVWCAGCAGWRLQPASLTAPAWVAWPPFMGLALAQLQRPKAGIERPGNRSSGGLVTGNGALGHLP